MTPVRSLDQLAETASDALARGRRDSELLDGRDFSEGAWNAAEQALAELVARCKAAEAERDEARDLATQFTKTTADLLAWAESSKARVAELEAALREADDLLRRLSEWDMLSMSHDGTPITSDGPFWQSEIAKARRVLAGGPQA